MKIRIKVEAHMVLDTAEYPIPADGRLTLQLRDDIQEILETNIDATINTIKVTKTGQTNDEEAQDSDYDEQR